MTRPKDIGTAAETAVVRYLRANGFPGAERRALAGTNDLGDIIGVPGWAIEVKGGKAAEVASPGQVDDWMDETETERVNAGASYGLLVVKRRGVGVLRAGEWWAYLPVDTVGDMFDAPWADRRPPTFAVRMLLSEAVELIRWAGYGNPAGLRVAA